MLCLWNSSEFDVLYRERELQEREREMRESAPAVMRFQQRMTHGQEEDLL